MYLLEEMNMKQLQPAGFVPFGGLLDLPKECIRFSGEPFLVEIIYHKRTVFGGPRTLPTTVKSTRYVIGIVLPVGQYKASYPAWVVPTTGIIQWDEHDHWNYAENVNQSGQLDLYALRAQCEICGIPAFYRFAVGDEAVEAFFEKLSSEKGSSNDSVLVFWKAAMLLGHNLSDIHSVADALEQERANVIKEYVHGKARLFMDEVLNLGQVYSVKERVTAEKIVTETYKELLNLGLGENEIKYRAREYAMSGLKLV